MAWLVNAGEMSRVELTVQRNVELIHEADGKTSIKPIGAPLGIPYHWLVATAQIVEYVGWDFTSAPIFPTLAGFQWKSAFVGPCDLYRTA